MTWRCFEKSCQKYPLFHSQMILLEVVLATGTFLRVFCEACWMWQNNITGPPNARRFNKARQVHGGRANALKPISNHDKRGKFLKKWHALKVAGQQPRDHDGNKMGQAAWATAIMHDETLDQISYEAVMYEISQLETSLEIEKFSMLRLMLDFVPMVIGNEKSKIAVILKYICTGQISI